MLIYLPRNGHIGHFRAFIRIDDVRYQQEQYRLKSVRTLVICGVRGLIHIVAYGTKEVFSGIRHINAASLADKYPVLRFVGIGLELPIQTALRRTRIALIQALKHNGVKRTGSKQLFLGVFLLPKCFALLPWVYFGRLSYFQCREIDIYPRTEGNILQLRPRLQLYDRLS